MSHTLLRPPDSRSLVARWRRRAGLPLALVAVLATLPAAAQAADLHATTGNLSSVFSGAQGGDVIHLAAGSYGNFGGGSKPATVTLVPEPGAQVTMGVNFTPANHITLSGLTITGGTLSGAQNITIANSAFTATLNIVSTVANANILIDHNTFNNISPCGSCPEGRVTVTTSGSRSPGLSGVVISNSLFSGGTSDGVQITGNAQGVQVGPGNEFSNLAQSSSVHTDSIQLYGAGDTTITGNYIHDAAEGIMAPDGGDTGYLRIENNVFSRINQQGVYLGFKPGLSLVHNTFAAGVMIHDDPSKGGNATIGAIIRNNVLLNGVSKQNLSSGAIAQEDYNLLSGGSGAHDIKSGKPTFAGGASPTSFAGFLLAAGSLGVKAADDGADMGILPGPPPGAPGGSPAPAPAQPSGAQSRKLRRGAAPTIRLSRPAPGSRFRSLLKVHAAVKDNNGIDRVGYWLDRRWVGTDRKAPYSLRLRVPKGMRYRSHTLTVRAFSADGQVSSVAVTVQRVHRGGGARAARASARGGWRLSSKPATGGTALRGHGRARHRVVVLLTRCDDASARVARRLKLRATPTGAVRANLSARNLCVLRLQSVW